MGKGDRRSKAKRAREDWDGAVALAPTRKRAPSGAYARTDASNTVTAIKATLKTRLNMAGREVTKANMREARAPWWGCYAGRIIRDADLDEKARSALWEAICHMRKVVVLHDAAISAPKRHAVCMNLLVASGWSMPRSSETPEERQRRATAAMMQVEGWLGYADKPAASAAKRCVVDDVSVSDHVGVLIALRAVAMGMAGKPMRYIGR